MPLLIGIGGRPRDGPFRLRSPFLPTGSMKTIRSLSFSVVLAVAAFAGGLEAQQNKPIPGVRPPPPLAPMASQRVLVLPVQLLRADSGAWLDARGWDRFRRELDDSIGSLVAARGVGRSWKYASDAVRIAKRNPDYVSDPYSMGVQPMRTVVYKIGDRLPEPFVSNLRSLIALADTRYALVPVEAWFVRKGAQQIVVMKLALADGQGGSIVWLGEVGSDPATTMPPDLANTLATRVANLIIAP
ncbi:MAG: hypothetical protein ACHQQR_08380 [Gemmatimonadales bacterium]